MRVARLRLHDFRSYTDADVVFADGLTVIQGPNGEGKTNLVEALVWLSGAGSLRGAPDEALVRRGAAEAVVRAVIVGDDGREHLVEVAISARGRNRIRVDRRDVRRARDLAATLAVTVFAPDDLDIVKGPPARRRRWIDDAVIACRPRSARVRSELERILRQRNALLRQTAGRLDDDARITLDVWDAKLADVGEELRRLRRGLVDALGPQVAATYSTIAGREADIVVRHVSSWPDDEPLADALRRSRADDLRRGVSTVGPHRDEIEIVLDGMVTRVHASQGEQRSVAVALRLAVDRLVRRNRGVTPVLVLDDVFSELDDERAARLVAALPDGQRIVTTATGLPPGTVADRVLTVHDGTVDEAGGDSVDLVVAGRP